MSNTDLDLAMWRLLVILKDTVSVTRWGQRIERVEKTESVKGEIVNKTFKEFSELEIQDRVWFFSYLGS